jgi:nucleotide-binding universal stress UspA family protein
VHDEEDTLYAERSRPDAEVMRGPRVVAAVDGSAGSKAALRFALEDAARRNVPVEAVIAYRPPDFRADFTGLGRAGEERMVDSMRTQHEEAAHGAVRDVTRELTGPVPEVHVRAVMGTPSAVLVRESEGADLLVLGSRGHGGFHSMLLGSTSIQCTMHATCPVTVVHSPEAGRHRLRLHRERRREGESAARKSEAGVPT